MPANVVCTPLAFDTADLVKAPQVGIDLKNDPKKFARPSAIISWDASTIFPDAFGDFSFLAENNFESDYLQNDFAIATFARIDTSGNKIKPDPMSLQISTNPMVLFSLSTLKSGI